MKKGWRASRSITSRSLWPATHPQRPQDIPRRSMRSTGCVFRSVCGQCRRGLAGVGFFSGTSTLEQLETPLSSKKAPSSSWGCCAQPTCRRKSTWRRSQLILPHRSSRPRNVLAARSLPTADPDGPADPHLRAAGGEPRVARSLQIDVDADGQLEAQQLPPIVIRMLDKDDAGSGGLILLSSYEVMGQAQ